MVLGDRLKAIAAERDSFQRQLAEKEETVVRLQDKLTATENLAGENKTLSEKNRKLESEVRRLETTIGQFESIIKGVRLK
jgi:predicted nuclease with TOPRIM domain